MSIHSSKHWPDISKTWELVGKPLRPCDEDLGFIQSAFIEYRKGTDPRQVVILGVTPEYYHLPWPGQTELMAVDHTREMIEAVWPGPPEMAVCAEWSELPLADTSVDMVVCDGGLHLLPFPSHQRKLVSELHRVLKPGGQCLFRLFLPPDDFESTDFVLNQLLNGKISSLNHLKLMLWPSLQESPVFGVKLHDVWDVIHKTAPDLHQLAEMLGWEQDHLFVIDSYRNSSKKYYLLSLEEILQMFMSDPGGFEMVDIETPSYMLGERCPTLKLKKV